MTKYNDEDENDSSFEEFQYHSKGSDVYWLLLAYLAVAHLSLVSNHLDGDAGVIFCLFCFADVMVC